MAEGGQAEQQIEVLVHTDSRSLKAQPFIPSSDQISTGKLWEEWLESIEREFRFFKITDPTDKKDALIIFGGKEISRLSKSLPDPPGGANEFEKLRTKLNGYFTPKRNKHHARYLFLRMKPLTNESICTYASRLREKAQGCEFDANCDERILEHIIQTIDNKTLIQKTINKSWTLSQFLTEASQVEDVALQVNQMREELDTPSSVHQVSRRSRGRFKRHSQTNSRQYPQCTYCGLTSHAPGRNCPAYGKTCRSCGKSNHFHSMCRKSRTNREDCKLSNKSENSKKKNKVKKVLEQQCSDASSDDLFFDQVSKHLTVKVVKNIKDDTQNSKLIPVKMDDVNVFVEPDTGADVNLMDEHQFKSFTNRTQNLPVLRASNCQLTALQKKIQVKGEFKTVIRNQTCGIETTVIVIRGHMNSPPLLGRESLTKLGMMKISPEGTFQEKNDLRIKNITSITEKSTQVQKILSEYKHVFEGVGRFRDPVTKKEITVTLPMRSEAVPIAQKARPVPYYLQKPLKVLLDNGVKNDLFEKCDADHPITWCSPLVVQPKPRFTSKHPEELTSDMIRASTDLRIPNKYMERCRIIQGPIVEDFTHKFHECTVFSKMDLRQGYQQLSLDDASRDVVTFSTPWGNYRPKTLPFGAKTSQDVFDETMYRIFGDIPMCLNNRDDILIGGRDIQEHDETLRIVLKRASDYGITMNRQKCQFQVKEIEFYGYVFTDGKLKPAPSKVEAVRKCERPNSKEEVRSFLGMIGFLSKFIPRYSTLTAPLRELTQKDVKFKWGQEQEDAFESLKQQITEDSTVAYFNPQRPITVRVEASYHEGLSAGLFQTTEKGLQPVHFISRTMTPTEKRYSQTEKDALAVKWAKQRFRMYLLGAPRFKIVTAHKPIIPMFNRANIKLSPRIEKWVMEMQDADYEMVYEPGRDEQDPLDFLSRHPLPETGSDSTERVVRHVTETENAVVMKRIVEETSKDPQLQKIKERVLHEDWEKHKSDPDIAPFYPVREEISEIGGLMLRLNRIIAPRCLQRTLIKAAHRLGHLGTTKTKRMLREKYWFPSMDSMVETITKQCYECQVANKDHRKEPVKLTNIPRKEWDTVSMDFGGPYPDGHYNLVVIDKRTRYPEVATVMSTSVSSTKKHLRRMFTTHGVPNRVETDNGPPFNSREFADFAKEEGFTHHRVTPLHPRANGEAESFMKVLNKTEQISHLNKSKEDRETMLNNMLIGYRSTPHPATGISPYKALMNREVRIKLDYEDLTLSAESSDVIAERDMDYKLKAKRNSENKFTKEHSMIIGDYVLLKQQKRNKWSTSYEPMFYVIFKIHGSSISARRLSDGREITRDSSHFKQVNAVVENLNYKQTDTEDWRERLMQSTAIINNEEELAEPVVTNEQSNVTTTPLRRHPATAATSPATPTPTPPVATSTPTAARSLTPRPSRVRQKPAYLSDYVT